MARIDPRTGMPYKQGVPQPRNVLGSWSPISNNAQPEAPFTGVGSVGTTGPFSTTIQGFQPDYRQLIANDPIFGQMKSDLSAQGIGDAAQRAAATQRALIQFGMVPDLNGLGGLNQEFVDADVTGQTRQLAQQNTESGMSIAARQQKQFKDQVRAIKNSLAARGALRSGETGFQLQEAQRGFDEARFDTTQKILDYLAGVQAGYVAGERARQQQASQGAAGAMERQAALNPAQADRQIKRNPDGSWAYVDNGAPVPRDLWPDSGTQAAAVTSHPGGSVAAQPVSGGLTADAEARRRRQLLEGLLF